MLSSWVEVFSPAVLTWIFMWNEWVHLRIVEFIALNGKTIKNVGFRIIFLLQRSCYGSYHLFLFFAASVPLFSSAFCTYRVQLGVDGSIPWALWVSYVLLHKSVCLSSIYSFTYRDCAEFPCYASITWFIFSLTFSIFSFSSPLLCAVLIGFFMMTLPDAFFFFF